jgi:hypothetical protein
MLDELQWEMLVERVHEQRCVPFLGAAVNVESEKHGYSGLALGGGVANLLADKIGTPGELARVALEYEVRTDRGFLLQFLEDALPDAGVEPSPALARLAKLPLKLVITTNYDRLLERALGDREFTCLVQPADGFADEPEIRQRLKDLEQYEGTIVYKIHGTFQADDAIRERYWLDLDPGIIVTEDDYIEFLTTHESDAVRIGVPKLIKKLVTPSTLLFLGYSLQDWDFRTIYRGLVGRLTKHDRRKSFAVQENPPKFWVDYWAPKGVTIIDMDVYEFCDELDRRYFDKYPLAPP